MSEPQAPVSSPEPDQAVQFSAMKIAGATMIAGVLALLLFMLRVAVEPAQWEFGLEVVTEVAQVAFQPHTETHWRIDGATLCSRGALELPDEYRLQDSRRSCGGRAWRGWHIDAPEQVVVVHGGTTAALEATDTELAISLRSEQDSLGTFSVVGQIDGVELDNALNLRWSARAGSGMTFPFTGTTTLGRAVTWSDPRMLHSGTVSVYSSDESADQRTLVDEAALMLGDQVRLGAESEAVWPKGFIRVADHTAPLQVVAFGRAESLSIERFGDSGYDFKPDWVTKLASDPGVAFWGSLLIAYMTLVLGLLPLTEGEPVNRQLVPARYRYLRWLLRHRKS